MSGERAHICVVGGGITGLSFAHYLERLSVAQELPLRITILERDSRIGGKLQTLQDGEFLVEEGAESLHMQKPAIVNLLQEIGLEDELITPEQKGFYMLHNRQLHKMNPSLFKPYPHNLSASWASPFLSLTSKLRVTMAPAFALLGRRLKRSPEQSIAQCLRTRWGKEFSKTVLEPLYAGIHAGNAEQLSMGALYPHLEGHASDPEASSLLSLIGKEPDTKSPAVPFQSLKGGLGSLAPAIAAQLQQTTIRLKTRVAGVSSTEAGVVIRTSSNEEITADYTLLCVPSYVAAKLLPDQDQALTSTLSSISFASSAIVTLGFNRSQIGKSFAGTGFISSSENTSLLTACTWSSQKWQGRSPADKFLLRGYLGNPHIEQDVLQLSEEELIRTTQDTLSPLMDISGSPFYSRVDIWRNALPQYDLNHLQRVNLIEQQMRSLPGIALSGASYRGLGVPDCIRQGQEAARKALTFIQRKTESPVARSAKPSSLHSAA